MFEEAIEQANEAMALWLEDQTSPVASKLGETPKSWFKEWGVPSAAIPQYIEAKAPKSVQLNVTIAKAALIKIDAYAKKAEISRSALLQNAALEYVQRAI